MSKHTKGPWLSVNGPCDDDFQCVCVVDHMTVCAKEVIGSAEDDARLIAAAPELLEALERLIKLRDDGLSNDYYLFKDAIDAAREVAKKARGEA